jgi:hypothetical protein
MRGLAFPSNAVFDRETSYEYGSPFSNVETIPIDPALGGPAIGPAIMAEGSNVDNVPVSFLQLAKNVVDPTRRVLQFHFNWKTYLYSPSKSESSRGIVPSALLTSAEAVLARTPTVPSRPSG